jgi:hypothetical protein
MEVDVLTDLLATARDRNQGPSRPQENGRR